MEGLIVLLVLFFLAAPVVSLVMVIRQKDKIRILEDQNAEIRFRLSDLEQRLTPDTPAPQEGASQKAEEPVVDQDFGAPLPEEAFEETMPADVPVNRPPGKVKPVRPGREKHPLWTRLEHQFLDNWTGILGSVIMVLGAGFLSIYAALRFDEFIRFILLLLLSALPALLFYLLKDREKWQRQALWMRSISGAIFLFACLGSAGIPGLQWVHNPVQSLGLLILGIAVNLGLSSFGRREEYASFHSILSLLALSVMTPGSSSLVMAVIITLYALIHCYRNRWDVHLLLIITGFAVYHIYWMYSLPDTGAEALRIQGAAALSLIFLVSTFVHYRKSYASAGFELFPFLTHLVNWLYFSVGMYLYIGGKPERSLILLAGSVLAFSLSARAGRKGVSWLQTTGITMGQILFTATLISLKGWDVENVMIGGFIYVEVLLFLWMMVRQNRTGLYRFAVSLYTLSTLLLIALCLHEEGLNSLIYATGITVTGLLHHRTLFHMKESRWLVKDTLLNLKNEFSVTGLLAGISALSVLVLIPQEWAVLGPFWGGALAAVILAAYHDSPSRGLRTGTLLYLALFTALACSSLLESDLKSLEETVLPLMLVVTAGMTFFWRDRVHRFISYSGLLIGTATILILSFLFLNPVSPLLPGLFWLSAVLLLMEAPRIPERFRTMAVLFLAAFTVRHFTLHIRLDQAWGFFRQRYLLDGAFMAVLFLWRRRRESLGMPVLKGIVNFSLDAGFIMALVLLGVEVPVLWIPLSLSLFSLSVILYRRITATAPRILFYSFILYLTSLVLLCINLLRELSGKGDAAAGVLTLVVLLACLVLFILKENFRTLTGGEALQKTAAFLERGKNTVLLYSLAAAGAFFLFVSFDPSYLTLLWAVECFMIFSASLFLGETHFRAVSQGGLLLCVIRLVFVDLSESAPLLRGLVFLAVGLLMLGTNSLYNRYKGRFVKGSAPGQEDQEIVSSSF